MRSPTWYTLQVSNHPKANGASDVMETLEVGRSWRTVYDGEIESPGDARRAVVELCRWFKHARAFRGRDLGRLWYWQNAPVVPAPVAEKSH